MKKIHILVCLLLIVAAAIATLMYYPDLPASIPVHWNFNGMPDKYGPRAMLYLLGPGLMGMMLILGLCLPWFSPRRFGLASFKATYSYFIVVLVGIFGLLYAVVLHAILTDTLEIQRTIYVGVFLLLILLGNPMGKVKRNFYIGIRTPWTLASERVWYATHRLSARVMVASGLLGLIAVFIGASAWILLVLASSWVVIVTVFSLVYYKRLDALDQS
ncbi:SdpI family protein [Serratia sp. D1N4]